MKPPLLSVAEGTTNPVGALLRGSAVPALLGLALLTVVALPFGVDQVKSSLVGGGMAILAMGVGPLIHQFCRNLDPAMSLGIAVLAYCLVIGLLWIGFSLLNDTSWLVGEFGAAGVSLRVRVDAHAVEVDDGLDEPDARFRRQRAGGAAFVAECLRQLQPVVHPAQIRIGLPGFCIPLAGFRCY